MIQIINKLSTRREIKFDYTICLEYKGPPDKRVIVMDDKYPILLKDTTAGTILILPKFNIITEQEVIDLKIDELDILITLEGDKKKISPVVEKFYPEVYLFNKLNFNDNFSLMHYSFCIYLIPEIGITLEHRNNLLHNIPDSCQNSGWMIKYNNKIINILNLLENYKAPRHYSVNLQMIGPLRNIEISWGRIGFLVLKVYENSVSMEFGNNKYKFISSHRFCGPKYGKGYFYYNKVDYEKLPDLMEKALKIIGYDKSSK